MTLSHGARVAAVAAALCAAVCGLLQPVAAQDNCRPGWSKYDGRCWRYETGTRTWQSQENVCRTSDAHLASIHSSTDMSRAKTLAGGASTWAWIGLNDIASEGTWRYTDGSSYDYSAWGGGEPNNSGNEDCAHFWNLHSSPSWNDWQCNQHARGFCTHDVGTLMRVTSCGLNRWGSRTMNVNGRGVNIYLNGAAKNPSYSRGMNVFYFDKGNVHSGWQSTGRYDTYASSSAATSMATYINNIPSGRLVVVLCWDECSRNLNSNARTALGTLGASLQNNLAYRDSYILVATKGGVKHHEARHQDCLEHYYVAAGDIDCPAGTYTSGLTCPSCGVGKYSSNGDSCSNCNAGRYGSSTGLTSASCTASCPAGYYCPAGTSSYSSNKCPAGKYSTGGASSSSCTGSCAAGHYCPQGSTSSTPHQCPAGKYGSGGSGTSGCSGSCQAGYFCGAGSTSKKANKCGGNAKYCPTGSSAAQSVGSGYYTTGDGGEGAQTRTGRSQCEKGYYCPGDGSRYLCPAGKYGNTKGLTNNLCSGQCSAGYYCAAGSTSSTAAACGTGTAGSVNCAAVPANCYCPAGTPTRLAVPEAYYSVPEDTDEAYRSSADPCPPSYTCEAGVRELSFVFTDCKVRSIAEGANGAVGDPVTAVILNGAPIQFSISSPSQGTGCNWGAPPTLTMNPNTGQITMNANTLDHEECDSISVVTTATSGEHAITCTTTIAVDNVNEGPAFLNCHTARNVEEMSPVNTNVGSAITASDPDLGESLFYSIVGGTGSAKFAIGLCTGQITVADDAIAYTDATSYTLAIEVRDDEPSSPLSDSCTVTIDIRDRNDPPVVGDTSGNVAENTAPGTVVTGITYSDADPGDTVTWTVGPHSPANRFTVDSSNRIVTAGALDYEQIGSFRFTVTGCDRQGLCATGNVVIVIDDANDDPIFHDQAGRIDENSAPGTAVAPALVVADQDRQQSHTFSIVGGNGDGAFEVSGGTIVLAAGGSLDHESTPTRALTVRATDNLGGSTDATYTVTVNDVNEAPAFTDAAPSRSVSEAHEVGSPFGQPIAATDVDTDQGMAFAITGGDDNNGLFTISATTGVLGVAKALDFETKASYTLTVRVTDTGVPALFHEVAVAVAVTNANEAPAVTPGQERSVTENTAEGTAVAGSTLAFTDPDAGDSATWSIIAGNEGAFSIDAAGELTVENTNMLNYEARTSFLLTVRVTDAGGAYGEGSLTVNIHDANESPLFAEDAPSVRSIPEGLASGTLVGPPVSASDVDNGQSLTYTIVSQPSGNHWAIDASTGQLSANGQVPALTNAPDPVKYDLVVRATDDFTFALATDQAVEVWVTDQNDAPIFPNAARTVAENSASGTNVGFPVTATDPDGDTLTYKIVSQSPANNAFAIDATTGQITVSNAVLDFETAPTYTVVVRATDSRGVGPLSDEATVTITLTNVNEAPVMPPNRFEVAENSAVDTAVGSCASTDVDAGDSLSYSITGGNNDGQFKVDASTGAVSVARAELNFERKQTYIVTVQVEDAAGLAAAQDITIQLTDENDAPVFSSFAAISVAEEVDTGTLVGGPIAAADEDADDEDSYAILTGNTGGAFSINDDGQLAVAARLNYDAGTTQYALQVQVTDAAGATDTVAVTVKLLDVNEAPTAPQWAAQTVAENSDAGTQVFTVSFDDVDAGDVHTYSISDGNVGGRFAIDPNTGTVAVDGVLNYEALAAYELTITAVDKGGLTGTGVLSVTVTDVPEAPVLSKTSHTIAENSATGTAAATAFVVADEDGGESHTFTIISGNNGALFSIDGASILVDQAALDFEAQAQYTIRVRVADKDGLTDTQDVTVVVSDVNEAPVIDNAVRSVDENRPVNFFVQAPVPAWDQDEGQLLRYEILSGNEKDHFKINPCDGQISIKTQAVDFESQATYSLVVRVTDDGPAIPGPPALSDTATVTIHVNDINEPPVINDAVVRVDEARPLGHLVHTIEFFEQDASQFQTFSVLSGNENGFFTVEPETGKLTVARTGLDFETQNTYRITVQCLDSGLPVRLSDTALLTIIVDDINEPPNIDAANRAVAENSSPGTLVGAAIGASDADAGDNGRFTFSLDATDSPPFVIDAVTGQLTVKVGAALDFEGTSKYHLAVTATDGGSPALSGTATIVVSLTDVNEPPTVVEAELTVDENSAKGTFVGAPLTFSDPDHRQTLALEIVSQTVPGVFAIGALTGQLEVNTPSINFEQRQLYTVRVRITDSGDTRLTDEAVVVITVNDLNEAPVIAPGQSRSVNENAGDFQFLGLSMSYSDEDRGDSAQFAIVEGANNHFKMSTAGQLYVDTSDAVAGIDFETQSVYHIKFTITDSGGAVSTGAVDVHINDLNERPVFQANPFAFSMAETAAVGIRVGTLTTFDQDAGSILTWTLTTNAEDIFRVDPASGDLLVKTTGVADVLQTYTLDVRVEDQYGLSDTSEVVVSIIDSNEPPIVADQARSVAENAAAGTVVGAPVVATDEENDAISFYFESGNDNGAFAIAVASGQITVRDGSKLNHEVAGTQVLKVKAVDNGEGALSSLALVTVTITDVNEAPTILPKSFVVSENSPAGTTVAQYNGADQDDGDTAGLAYEIVGGNAAGRFRIAAVSGGAFSLQVAKAELNAENKAQYVLAVQVTDGSGLTGQADLTVDIADENDAPVMGDASRSIPENTEVGTVVGVALAVHDDDLGSGTQTLTFSIESGNTNGAFGFAAGGQLVVASTAALDFEAQPTFSLGVRVTDNGEPAKSDTATVTVTVLDVNESPVFAQATYAASVAENSGAGVKLAFAQSGGNSVTASDPEAGYQSLTYSIAGESLAFKIDAATGVLSTKPGAGLNYEAQSQYTLTIEASDGLLEGETTVVVTVTDVNEAPAWLALPVLTINENSGVGAAVSGGLVAGDVDAGANGVMTYTITGGSGQALFSMNPSTAAVAVADASLDYEAVTAYFLIVTVTDGGGLSDVARVDVAVLDVNERPTVGDAARSVDENVKVGTAVGAPIKGSDPDVGQALTLEYTLTGGDVSFFTINKCSGQIMVNTPSLDFEAKSSYTVQVTVTDDDTLSPPHLTDTATVTISILDINEAPVLADATYTVNENAEEDTALGTSLVATDQDRPNDALTFSIEAGNDAGMFAVNPATGRLVVARGGALDHEVQERYTLTARVTDEHGLHDEATVTVHVLDVNEHPTMADVECAVDENSPGVSENLPDGTAVCKLSAFDQDEGQTEALTYMLWPAGNTGGAFALSTLSGRGYLTVAASVLNYEAKSTYTMTVTVTDDGQINGAPTPPLAINRTLTVRIGNVNEKPVINNQVRDVDENSPRHTAVGAQLVASDPDSPNGNPALVFSIVAGNTDNTFNISTTGGQLTVSNPPNFETRGSYTLTIRVVDTDFDTHLSDEATVVVTINDVNEAPVLTVTTLEVNENSGRGTPCAPVDHTKAIFATDVDAADLGQLRFSITRGNDDFLFGIDEELGAVFQLTNVSLDHETKGAYDLDVTVTDASGATHTKPLIVYVRDVNEAPWVKPMTSTVSLRERMPVGTPVMTVSGADVDDGDSWTYYLVDEPVFDIDPARGRVTIANADADILKYVTNGDNVLNITVGVRDRAGLTGERSIYVNLVDNNFAPTLDAAALSVAENSAAGTVVGTIVGQDTDNADMLSYEIVSVSPASATALFSIATVAEVNTKNVGVLRVADTSALANPPELDFETYPSVTVRVTVTDTGPGNLQATRDYQVSVVDINERPVVAAPAAGATLHVDENVPVGRAVGAAMVWADQDVADPTIVLALSYTDGSEPSSLPFTIDTVTGQMSVASAVLDHETTPTYAVTVTGTDAAGLSASVDIVVSVDDVNEVPTASGQAFNIAENSPAGTVLGSIPASDVDADTVLTWSLVSDGDDLAVAHFTIEPTTGEVSVAPDADLDWESKASYTVTVRVEDDGLGNPSRTLFTDVALTIDLNDVNDVTIVGFNLDGSDTNAAAGSGAAGVRVPTNGNTVVTILGRNFGKKNPGGDAVTVSAYYVSKDDLTRVYTATDCAVVEPYYKIQCKTVPGVGKDLKWSVTVNGHSTLENGVTISYLAPAITAVTTPDDLATAGATPFTVTGTNFGPAGTSIDSLAYGPAATGIRFKAVACEVTVAHSQLSCKAAVGVGHSLVFRLTIARLSSPDFASTATYAAPAVTLIDGATLMATQGGETVIVNGTNFGHVSEVAVAAVYGPADDRGRYLPSECRVTVSHVQIQCTTVPGIGAGHGWTVTVAGVASTVSSAETAYKAPTVVDVSGPGADDATTQGGELVYLAGTSFGTASMLPPLVTYGPPSDPHRYEATGCRVSAPHSQIECSTTEGTGTGLHWTVTIDGQASAASEDATAYARPLVFQYSGLGATNAVTNGGQAVLIEGRNFGKESSRIDLVTYGLDDPTEFVATSCVVSSPHTFLSCQTGPGAGAGLTWSVTVDGQVSGAATTNYARPEVTALTGKGATGAATDGGDPIVIHGRNFGPADRVDFLEKVTYGASGLEYTARDCAVVDHETITCTTVPGVGENLQWIVYLYGQRSNPSGAVASRYATPTITVTSVLEDTTSGGAVLTVNGSDWGLETYLAAARTSNVQLLWNGAPLSSVSDFAMLGGSSHSLRFTVPEATKLGATRDIAVRVTDKYGASQTSAPKTFTYHTPVIEQVFRLRNDVLRMEGQHFGVGGTVTVTDSVTGESAVIEAVDAITYTHTVVEVLFDSVSGNVKVARGEQVSNVAEFESVVPTIAAAESENGAGEKFFLTQGGQTLLLRGYDMGEEDHVDEITVAVRTQVADGSFQNLDCPLTSFVNFPGKPIPGTSLKEEDVQEIQCALPPGQGFDQFVIVTVRGNPSPAKTISYEVPWIETLSTTYTDPTLLPTSGDYLNTTDVKLRLTGKNFGVHGQVVTAYRCPAGAAAADCLNFDGVNDPLYIMPVTGCTFTHTTAECDAPEGEGPGLFVRLSVDASGSFHTDNPLGQYRHPGLVLEDKYGFANGFRPTVDFEVPRIFAPAAPTPARRRLEVATAGYTSRGRTAGGWQFQVRGSNFGRPTTPVSITVGPYTCPVTVHTHTELACTMPAGQGTDLPVTVSVAGLSNPALPAFSFDPPRLDNTSITSGPTSAVTSAGERLQMTLRGDNFGLSGAVRFDPNPADATQSGDAIVVPAGDVVSWSHTSITVKLPPGQGRGRRVVIVVGGQTSPYREFNYDQPAIGAVEPDVITALGEFLPTAGGYNVTVRGNNFGTYAGRVVVHNPVLAGFECPGAATGPGAPTVFTTCELQVVAQTHTWLKFIMPAGIGRNWTLVVGVGVQESPPVHLSYDPPKITAIRPNEINAKGQQIKIDGVNFGRAPVGLEVLVHGLPCRDTLFVTGKQLPGTNFVQPPHLQCTTAGDAVGYKNITVSIAGQTVSYFANSTLLRSRCEPGDWGVDGELCLACMRGAECAGYGAEPVSQVEWWIQNATDDQCDPLRRQPASHREYCPQTIPCEPKLACAGENECTLGYAGERCATCAFGYYKRAGFCEECPKNPLILVIGMVSAAVVLCAGGYILNKNSVNLAFVSIGVDYFQILALFATSRVTWPATIKEIFTLMSAFNFNLEITAPECSFPELGFKLKWVLIMALPLAALTLFGLLHVSLVGYKFLILGRRKRLNRHAPAMVGTILVMMYYLYLYLTRTTLDVFNCAPTDPPDGHTYLEVVFERCDLDGGIHQTLLPLALLTLGIYVLGYPAVVFFSLYKNRHLIMEDQLLRANGVGNDRNTNPNAYLTRKRLHKLYYHFKPDNWYWMMCILARKFCIAFTALMFNKNAAFQLSVALLVMFVSYAAQVKWRPYMSPSEHQEVLRAHKLAAAVPGSVHERLSTAMKAIAKRKRVAARRFSWNGSSNGDRAAVVADYFWNYNTVEMVLLFCAVLVVLAGVMFESGQLDSEYYQGQRDTITYITLTVIFFSLLYFGVVFCSEVWATISANRSKGKKGKKGKGGSKRSRRAAGGSGGGSGRIDLLESRREDKIIAAFNPMMVRGGDGAAQLEGASSADQLAIMKAQMERFKADNEELLSRARAAERAAASKSVHTGTRTVRGRKKQFGARPARRQSWSARKVAMLNRRSGKSKATDDGGASPVAAAAPDVESANPVAGQD